MSTPKPHIDISYVTTIGAYRASASIGPHKATVENSDPAEAVSQAVEECTDAWTTANRPTRHWVIYPYVETIHEVEGYREDSDSTWWGQKIRTLVRNGKPLPLADWGGAGGGGLSRAVVVQVDCLSTEKEH